MPRGFVDFEALNSDEVRAMRSIAPPEGLPFNITKLGHVVLDVQDLRRSVEFYTQVLGFLISDVYPDSMMPGGMVFMRCNNDHHAVALVGQAEDASRNIEMHHLAFEVATLDEVIRARDHLRGLEGRCTRSDDPGAVRSARSTLGRASRPTPPVTCAAVAGL